MINLSQFYPTAFDQNNFVYATGDQRISGQKDFAVRPTVNGSPVVLYGEFCPGDNNGGGTISISGDAVFVTGDQEVFDNKKFENATNLLGSPFLASGEGKYLEKYFYTDLANNNLEYLTPYYPNTVVVFNIIDVNNYSVKLPSILTSQEGDSIKYIFNGIPTGLQINGQTWQIDGTDVFQEGSGFWDIQGYFSSGLFVNFYVDTINFIDEYSEETLIDTFVSPRDGDFISFIFTNGYWGLDKKEDNIVPSHFHSIDEIEGLSGILSDIGGGTNFIHLEKVFNHTFEDGLDILYSSPYERNSYVNLTFNTASPCYIDLPNPTGDVLNGDRILFNVQSVINQSERLIIRHNPFNNDGNYLPYENLFSIPIPSVNDAIEFWYQEPEWKIKFAPVGGSGSWNGGGNDGTECCSTLSFAGNRTIKRINWPLNYNPQAEDVVTFLNRVFYPFQAASVNLNAYTLKELGTNFSNVPFIGNITQNDELPNGITNLRLLNGNNVIQTIQNPSFGSFNYPTNLSIDNTSTLSVRITTNNEGDPSEISDSQVVSFEAPMYFGAGASNLNESQIKSNLQKQLESRSTKIRAFTANNQKLYIVIPIHWGLFTSIKDQNGFQNINGWSSRIVEFTLANGVTKQNYYIWETNNLVFNVNNFNYTFEF